MGHKLAEQQALADTLCIQSGSFSCRTMASWTTPCATSENAAMLYLRYLRLRNMPSTSTTHATFVGTVLARWEDCRCQLVPSFHVCLRDVAYQITNNNVDFKEFFDFGLERAGVADNTYRQVRLHSSSSFLGAKLQFALAAPRSQPVARPPFLAAACRDMHGGDARAG